MLPSILIAVKPGFRYRYPIFHFDIIDSPAIDAHLIQQRHARGSASSAERRDSRALKMQARETTESMMR
jgi:hypothetical protein